MKRFTIILTFIAFPALPAAILPAADPVADRPVHPNIVLILADDMGFSDLGCYGGEIATPNLDQLAKGGLRFTQMYNTARCWPTRACLLTGYYAQQVNRDPPGNRPGWSALLPQLLTPAGYRSYHSGKWHVDGKPVASGFDRSYWLEDTDRYFTPRKHYLDDKPLPAVQPADHYYATVAIAQHAIDFLRDHGAEHKEQPFFLYLAFIAPHFPLMAPADDIAKYKNRYVAGWDVLREQRWKRMREMGIVDCKLSARDPNFTPRYWRPDVLEKLGPGEVQHALAWDELTAEQKRFEADKMAIHAAMVDRLDQEVGRVFEQLRKMNAWDNTLIVFLSDNGADATIMVRGDGHDRAAPMGSASSFLCIGPGWATLSNTPFRRHKVWVHEGGISTSCILSWPKRIPVAAAPSGGRSSRSEDKNATLSPAGALRHTPAHIIDFVPTVLELAGVTPPEHWNYQKCPPLPGKSLVPIFQTDVEIPRDFLYWNHEGNHALRVGDWKIVAERENNETWELYNLKTDRIESHDLSGEQPDRRDEMAATWKRLDEQFRRDAGQAPARRATKATSPAR